MKKILKLVFLLPFLGLFFIHLGSRSPASVKNKASDARLLVVISVDQMRYDFLTRFQPYFKHGFKRLLDEGAVFSDAHHRHAITHTAPGHASLSTGCHPSKHGVVANDFYNPETNDIEYCVVDNGVEIIGVENEGALEGKSPKNLLRTTLGDWMKKDDRRSKVYSVAFKDRSSVLMGGQKANRAFWFDNISTRFVSSSYYKEDFPDWAKTFDARTIMAKELEEGWNKKFDEDVYKVSREDDFFMESGQFLPSFPHSKKYIIGRGVKPEMKDGILLWTSPFGDAFAIEFAKRLIEEEQLGKDDHIDLLNLGCSIADAIGHHYGPYSQEIQDYYLRLDEYLGDFFNFLDEKVGKDRYIVALSSDHGVIPLPEELIRRGVPAKRILSQDFYAAIDSAALEVMQDLELSQSFLLSRGSAGFSLKYEEAYEKKIKPAALQEAFAKALEKIEFIEEVFTTEELEDDDTNDHFLTLYQNSYREDRGFEMKVRYKENYLVNHRNTGTSHGTPYEYDTNVPIIFMGPGFKTGHYENRIATVDFAPTIAWALDVKADKGVDGRPFIGVFEK